MVLIQRFLSWILFLVFLLFAGISLFLQETGLQYVLALVLIVLGGVVFVSVKNKCLSVIDIGWVACLLWSIIYVIYAALIGREVPIVIWQSLMFFMPLTQYLVWFQKLPKYDQIIRWILFACFLKIPVFLINYEEVLDSLRSISGRARFHDYISIVLVFCIFPVFLYFKRLTKTQILLLLSFLGFFIVTAAHRSAYLALAAQFLIWYFVYTGSNKLIKFRIVLVVIIFVAMFLIFTKSGNVMVELFLSASSGDDGNANARLDLTSSVISGWSEYFWGHGFGLEYMYGLDAKGNAVFYALQHNSFLTPFYYLGVVFSILYAVSLIYMALMPLSGSYELLYLRSVLTGMGVFAYFNLWFENPLFAIPYWIVFGCFKMRMKLEVQNG